MKIKRSSNKSLKKGIKECDYLAYCSLAIYLISFFLILVPVVCIMGFIVASTILIMAVITQKYCKIILEMRYNDKNKKNKNR